MLRGKGWVLNLAVEKAVDIFSVSERGEKMGRERKKGGDIKGEKKGADETR